MNYEDSSTGAAGRQADGQIDDAHEAAHNPVNARFTDCQKVNDDAHEAATPARARKNRPDDATFQRLEEELKSLTYEELISHGLLHRARNFNFGTLTGFCCPLCNSGNGENGTGAAQWYPDEGKLFCHSCRNEGNGGHKLSAIDLYMQIRHIGKYSEAVFALGRELGLWAPDEGLKKPAKTTDQRRATNDAKAIKDVELDALIAEFIRDDITEAQAHVDELPESARRGLSLETLRHFGCGFIECWTHPKTRAQVKLGRKAANGKPIKLPPNSRRLVIPSSDRHYHACALNADRANMKPSLHKMHCGSHELFNNSALTQADVGVVVVVEGEIDCMSLFQACAVVEGIAFCAAPGGNGTLLTRAIEQHRAENRKFIVLFDDDAGKADGSNPGQQHAETLIRRLRKQQIHAFNARLDDFMSEEQKQAVGVKIDANAVLEILGENALREAVTKIIDAAQVEFTRLEEEQAEQEDEDAHEDAPPDVTIDEEPATTRGTFADCPVDLPLPEEESFAYLLSKAEGGKLWLRKINKKGKETWVLISSAVIPTKKFVEPTSGQVTYEIALRVDERWRKIEVDGSLLGDLRTLHKTLCQSGALIYSVLGVGEFFNRFLATNYRELEKVKSYRRCGWADDDFTDFALPSPDCIVCRAGYDFEKIFKPVGDREEWKRKFVEVTDHGGTIARVIIGAALSAPLIRPLEIINPQVHLFGRRSIGKTPLCQFAVSIFGDPRPGRLSYSMTATSKAKLEIATAFSDLPTIAEELESVGARDVAKLSQDIYAFSMGTSNAALKKDGQLRESKLFHGARLSTGEHSLARGNSNAGELKRVLELRADELLPEDFASDLYGFVARNHGLFGRDWIIYVKTHLDDIRREFARRCDDFNDRLRKARLKRDSTQLRSLIVSLVAFKLFAENLLELERGNNEILKDFWLTVEQMPDESDIDDAERACRDLASWVASKEKTFWQESDSNRPNEGGDVIPFGFESSGKIFADGAVGFFPHILKRALEQDLGYVSTDKLLAEFAQKGLLITDRDATHRTHKIRIGTKTCRVVHFKAGVLSQATDSAESDFYEEIMPPTDD